MMLIIDTIISTITYLIVVAIVAILVYSYYSYDSLTDSELDDFNDIMMEFHTDPDYDDFRTIWNNRRRLIANKGRPIKFWIWGVYQSQPQFFNESSIQELDSWIREIERGIRRVANNATGELLDCIWMLYFATGNPEYPEIVRRVAVDCPKFDVRESARYTYRQIMGVEWNSTEIIVAPTPAPALAPTPPPAQPPAPAPTPAPAQPTAENVT